MVPKVSVCMITYNHEKFIAQAIESVLMQRTPFDYELVIGEDSSQDATAEIVASFARRYPEKIRALFSDKNMGAHDNFVRVYLSCQGEYVAFMDGDDYWISPDKLHKQLDFMIANSQCSGCFHPVEVLMEPSGVRRVWEPPLKKRFYHLDDYATPFVAHQSSVMFRHRYIQIPDWFSSVSNGDLVLQVLHLERGPIGFINEVMSVYRVHPGGVWFKSWSNVSTADELNIRTIERIVAQVQPHNKRHLMRRLCTHRYNLAHNLCDEGNAPLARKYAGQCIRDLGYDSRVSPFEPMKLYAHIYAGFLYRPLRAVKALFTTRKTPQTLSTP